MTPQPQLVGWLKQEKLRRRTVVHANNKRMRHVIYQVRESEKIYTPKFTSYALMMNLETAARNESPGSLLNGPI